MHRSEMEFLNWVNRVLGPLLNVGGTLVWTLSTSTHPSPHQESGYNVTSYHMLLPKMTECIGTFFTKIAFGRKFV